MQLVRDASAHAAILYSANMSVGVNVLAALVKQAAAILDKSTDIEIVEMHHRNKVDAPSGTALLLGEAAASGRGTTLNEVAVYARSGNDALREEGSIGFAALRGGDVVGDHSVVLALAGERIELSHKAGTRDIFASGALRAAKWLANKPSGLYRMGDILDL
jgi:4-hydroxy-tetrahydrodipicolinate reductase